MFELWLKRFIRKLKRKFERKPELYESFFESKYKREFTDTVRKNLTITTNKELEEKELYYQTEIENLKQENLTEQILIQYLLGKPLVEIQKEYPAIQIDTKKLERYRKEFYKLKDVGLNDWQIEFEGKNVRISNISIENKGNYNDFVTISITDINGNVLLIKNYYKAELISKGILNLNNI